MMWKTIKEKALELVQWAEKELQGKTGAEKRAAVVAKLCVVINIPYVPEWLEGLFEPLVYGVVVDKVCNLLNILTEHSFAEAELTPEQSAKAADLITVTPDGEDVVPHESSIAPEDIKLLRAAESVDDKLNVLYAKYVSKS
jgi:hypothetical protein